jgi:hypothetical protein
VCSTHHITRSKVAECRMEKGIHITSNPLLETHIWTLQTIKATASLNVKSTNLATR